MKKKLICLFSVACALCLSAAVFTACEKDKKPEGGGENPPVVGPVDPEVPDGHEITSVELGSVRVQLLSDTLVRIEEKGAKGFEDRPSYIVSNRTEWEEVKYETAEADGETLLSTSAYVVHVPKDKGAEDVYVSDKSGALLWSFTGMTDTNVYLPSPSDELKSWYFTDSPRIIPSEYGYSVNEDGGPLQDWDFDNDETDIFVFLPQGDYTQFCNDYTSLTGKSEFVSLQMLGFWDSRWYAYSAETALQQIKDYTDRGYSIDVLVIDTDWRTASSGTGYEINTQLFPNMSAFLDDCHDLGVNVIFNDHPEPVTSGNQLDKEEVAFRNENLTLILSLGLDYWWYDRNWSVALNSCDPDISVYAFGMYVYNWVTQEYLESITDLNEYAERALIMGNVDGCLHGKWNYASDISAHRYTIQWTGDIGATSDALAQEIYAAVFGGTEVGIPIMSSDIGGHTQPVTDSMYVRWFQYGALSSILRVHCTHKDYIGQEGRMPWMFGDTAEGVAHTYMDMRYRLLPLYYAVARQNYDGGLPVMRRLDINYPQYVEASRNDEYLLGDYILVAPINEATPTVTADDSQLTHTVNGAEVAGLEASYFNNTTFSGTPVSTRIDPNIDFDWGTGGPQGLGNDNFSVIWRGNITIGNRPAKLMFYADDTVIAYVDGVKVVDGTGVYDNYLTTSVEYAAGSRHTLEVRYIEEGGNAHVSMYYVENNAAQTQYNTRSVFIPEGTWIDVWTGERFVGPRTVTVSHALETSPIFVREGALVALAPNMVNTGAGDWSKLTLDVYPSVNFGAEIDLYEDDTTTVAYKHGQYRKTDIGMTYDSGKKAVVVNIGKAEGSFEGRLAFEERSWNVRVHAYEGWGGVTKVRVNGKLVTVDEYGKSGSAKPFAFTGAALDSDVAEFTFKGSVREAYEIEIYFASPQEAAINEEYDDTAVDFSLSVDAAGGSANFDTLGTLGWTSFGDGSAESPVNKQGVEPLVKYVGSYDKPWIEDNNFFEKQYTDGSGSRTFASAIASQKDFSLELKTTGEKAYYVLFVGGNQCTAKITVRDRAGNVRTEMFGNIEGRFLRRIVIGCEAGEESTLYVTYAAHASETSGTGTPTYLTLLGGYVSSVVPEVSEGSESKIEAEIAGAEAPDGTVNLSDAGADLEMQTLDWKHFSGDGANPERRIGGEGIDSAVFRSGQGFGDYPAVISYSDGNANGAHTGTREGTCSVGYITVNLTIKPNVKYVRLYTGTWNSSNVVEVYNKNGEMLAKSDAFTAGGTAEARIVTIRVNSPAAEKLIVIIRSVNAAGNGNVSLPAVALLGENEGAPVASLEAAGTAVTGSVNLSERGATDWKYVVNGAEKAGASAISGLTFSAFKNDYTDYAAAFSYTDGGADGEGLTGGRECDFVRFTVSADENTEYIELYVSAEGGAKAGVVVLDGEGRALLRAQPVTSSGNKACAVIRIEVTASAAETLTFLCYKGGSASGKFGIAAIAVK